MRTRDNEPYYPKKKVNFIVFFLYLILGAYFINYPFNFIDVSEYVKGFEKWIIFSAGILMLFGAINYFKAKKNN